MSQIRTARLVTSANDKQKLTEIREVSAARAPVRALADYIRSLQFPIDGGRNTTFSVVREMKAEPEANASYPAACVFVEGVDYDTDTQSLEQYQDAQFANGGVYISGDLRAEANVHIWTTEDFHRENALMALEDAANPVDWMAGFRLEMPFYYNLRADYMLLNLQYEDSDADNQRRYRKLLAKVKIVSPYAQFIKLPYLKPRAVVDFE